MFMARHSTFRVYYRLGGQLYPNSSSPVSSSPKSLKLSFSLGVLAYNCVYSTLRILFAFSRNCKLITAEALNHPFFDNLNQRDAVSEWGIQSDRSRAMRMTGCIQEVIQPL